MPSSRPLPALSTEMKTSFLPVSTGASICFNGVSTGSLVMGRSRVTS